MPTKTDPRADAPAPPPPDLKKPPMSASRTSHLFAAKAPKDKSGAVTSERIADDLDAFRKAGGRIEVLGTTRSLKRIDAAPDAPPPKSVSPFAKKRR